MEEIRPFEFKECVSILKSTGKKAKTLREFRSVISGLSETSLYHHVNQYFLKGHILEYTNDFAHWAGEDLEERTLAEELSNIDPYSCKNTSELRRVLLEVIDNYLERFPEPREVREGEEFFFNETITLVFPSGVTANNLAEFLIAIKYIDPSALYYHFYDARARLNGSDDFSLWFENALDKGELAGTIRAIDPFMHSIESLRERIVQAVDEEVKKEMVSRGDVQ
jgi:hypothetical protein